MKKNLFFAAMAIVLASCASDDFVGENNNSPNPEKASNAIVFSSGTKATTRADIYGPSAATLLGNNFYVTGTKGTEADNSPTPTLVFDNYLVHYGVNTAGTTESNTSNWEYVGIDQATGVMTPENYNRVKLSSINGAQTIKYWDYSVPQYDFLAFSTGTYPAVSGSSTADTNIGVTSMKYGAGLANGATAYTFDIPTVDALKNTFITDIVEVERANYGKEVTLKFKNLGSKVRVALYETVPGYSVKNVTFYQVDGTTDFTGTKSTTAALISAADGGIPTKGTISVYFPHVGDDNDNFEDYNKAATTVAPIAITDPTNPTDPALASYQKAPTFGLLTAQLVGSERDEVKDDGTAEDGNVFLGRTLTQASFAGSAAANFYQTVFPVSTSSPLTLRVDYTLVPIDGAAETINVKGAKAVVPSTYTKWQPNYAYTYIFKISDNTNGWTGAASDPYGLFPITFDAVVAEATDANAEQTTITTVATPTITTYQQGHNPVYDQTTTPPSQDEYSKSTTGPDGQVRKLYVQVMDNSTATASLVTTLTATNSLLYTVSDADATEAEVMDALEKRITALDVDNVTGRNSITLTKNSNIDATVTSIVNGPDDNPITVSRGSAAEIAIGSLAIGTYAYVYDYTSGDKTTVTELQPIDVTGGSVGTTGKNYYKIATSDLATLASNASNFTTDDPTDPDDEKVNNDYIYFSVTTNGTGTTIYSYVSVTGKTTLPAGLLKVAKSTILTAGNTVGGGAAAEAGNFYFDTYITNNGKYAVKVIKIVA